MRSLRQGPVLVVDEEFALLEVCVRRNPEFVDLRLVAKVARETSLLVLIVASVVD